jgi:ABC-2 type transport system permease protein
MTYGRLARALARRAWAQQGRQALILPAAVATALVVLLLVAPRLFPAAVHGDLALPSSGPVRITTPDPATADAAMATALLTAPEVLSVAAALLSLTVSRALLGPDVSGGTAETLLATSLRPRTIFLGYLTVTYGLSLLAWATLAGVFLGLATLVIEAGGSSVAVTGAYGATVLFVPLASMLWATSLLTFVAFLRPAWLKVTAGLNGGPVRLAALAPALVAVVTFSLHPGSYQVFVWAYVAGCAGAALTLLAVLGALFTGERLLDS